MAPPTTDRSEYRELGGSPDAALFFLSLGELLVDATTIFIEVGSPDEEVISTLDTVAQEGPYLPARETLWPRARLFRLEFSELSRRCLAAVSDRHATPEFVDHLSVFSGMAERLYWPDAFVRGCPLYVAATERREVVREWGRSIGLAILLE